MEKSLKISPLQARSFLMSHPLKPSIDPRMLSHFLIALENENSRLLSVIEKIIRAFCRPHVADVVVKDFEALERTICHPKTGRRIQAYDNDDGFGYRHIPKG
jgi:hypothetical protein